MHTARELHRLGRDVGLFCTWRSQLRTGQILHLFGMSPEGLSLTRIAKERGTRVALSPICWYEPHALWALAPHFLGRLRALGAWSARMICSRLPSWKRELLHLVDAVLPNSVLEARQLSRLFGVASARLHTVPNGVAMALPPPDHAGLAHLVPWPEFILYAGRIEPRKNVLGLIQAASRAQLPLLIIGSAPPNQSDYMARCRARVRRGTVRFLERMEPEDPRLAAALAQARVVALPSWFETPGLFALEGALAGAAVVITPFGSTREYFGPLASYARPDDTSGLARALIRAWQDGPPPGLASHIRTHFLWSHVARKTAEVYDQLER